MSEVRPLPLAPRFARRMAPLAVLAGLLVGVVLPTTWQRLSVAERRGEAQVRARQLADALEGVVRARPELWAYDTHRLDELSAPMVAAPVNAEVRVDVVGRANAFRAGAAVSDGVAAWGAVKLAERTVGRVRVRLDASRTRATAQRVWSVASVCGLLLAAGLFFLPLATVRRGDVRDMELWDALERANAHLEARVAERTAELRRLGARLLAVQEEERARISRDLHDDLGQTLTGLRLRLEALEVEGVSSPHLEAAQRAIDDGVAQVRGLAHNLRPPALDALGLADALRGHAERWAQGAGLALTLDVDDIEPRADAAEALFRVAQEALTNVARHARATRVSVRLEAADDGWRLQVEDDGRGLPETGDEGRPGGGVGLGLVGARERVVQVGGYLDVGQSDAGGMSLLAWVPAEV